MQQSGRRAFLMASLGGVVTAATAAVFYPVYRYLALHVGTGQPAKLSFPETVVAAGEAKFFDLQGASAVLVRKESGDLVVLSAVCTHLGCIVQWRRERQDFLCPCHAGSYTADGAVSAGPPPRPLARIPFTVVNGTITIG